MKMSLIIVEVSYGSIDADDYTCNDYYNIRFSSSQFILQTDLNIDVEVISSDGMVFEGTYYFPINVSFHYYASSKNKSNNKIVSLRKTINS